MIKRLALSLLFLVLLTTAGLAQSATTYTLAAPNSGVWGGYLRAFGVRFSDPSGNTLTLNWIQDSGACSGQQPPFVGFVFATLPGQAELSCIPLQAGSGNNYGSFAGTDANGIPFTAVYNLSITTAHKCSGGRDGGCHTVFTITSGEVTITQ